LWLPIYIPPFFRQPLLLAWFNFYIQKQGLVIVLVILAHASILPLFILHMLKKRLKILVKKGSEITDREIEEMYAVRAHFMWLKPDVPREKDFNFFSTTVKAAHQVFLFVTETGNIKGLYVVTQFIERSTLTNKKRLVVEPEFGFILDEYQGKYMSKTVQRNAIRAFFRYPLIPKYLLGPAYPASYLTLKKYGGCVYTWQDPHLPAHIKDVICTYAKRNDMWNDGEFTGIKSLYTLPKQISNSHLERLKKKQGYLAYEQLNPKWQEGYGLITLTQLKFSTLITQVFKKFLPK
jgi:hypothetical protein